MRFATRRAIGPIGTSACIAVGAAVLLWSVGVSLAFAVAVAVLAIAIGITVGAFAGSAAPARKRERPTPRPGTRSEVAQLSWTLRARAEGVSDAGRKRLRMFARRRLRRAGLDVDDPADAERLRALLGDKGFELVTSENAKASLADVERCVTALDGLAVSDILATVDTHRVESGR
jgi:hypothetical protein